MKRLLALIAILAISLSISNAKNIKGTVTCNGRGVKGVIVTDGYGFTKTDINGKYRLATAFDARFVYIVTPGRYTVDYSTGVPQFYKPIGNYDIYDFEINKSRNTDNYTLFSISDPQMKTRAHVNKFRGKPYRDLVSHGRKYARKGQMAAIMLGDIGWDSIDLTNDLYKDIVKNAGFPIYTVIGNHDHNYEKKGDRWAAEDYEDSFGPSNYAFWIGKDLVICLDNILYDTKKKYDEGYSEEVLSFLDGLLRLVPKGTHLFVAQHSPTYIWRKSEPYIIGAEKFLKLLDGYKVDILSGHTHFMNNIRHTPDILEHNAASICGAWWETDWCRDGTPSGYEIFSNRRGKLAWFYHSLGYKDDFQVEIIKPGESVLFPDAVIANVWDYDEEWTVEWYQDGVRMGEMERVKECSPTFRAQIAKYNEKHKDAKTFRNAVENDHYFKAVPQAGSAVTIVVKSRFGKEWKFDVQ